MRRWSMFDIEGWNIVKGVSIWLYLLVLGWHSYYEVHGSVLTT